MKFSENQLKALAAFYEIDADELQEFVAFAAEFKAPRKTKTKPKTVVAKCKATTKTNTPCTRNAKKDCDGYCYAHIPKPKDENADTEIEKPEPVQCKGTTKANVQCSKNGKYDGYCKMHIPAPIIVSIEEALVSATVPASVTSEEDAISVATEIVETIIDAATTTPIKYECQEIEAC